MTGDRGQIMLLSALAACAFLIALAAVLYSVSESDTIERPLLQREEIDNILWAHNAGLRQAAGETGGCQWEQRTTLAGSFKAKAHTAASSIERSLRVRGIAFSSSLNVSLGLKYLEDGGVSGVECIGGVLIKMDTGNASVCGYAYDASLADGLSRYDISTVKIWA